MEAQSDSPANFPDLMRSALDMAGGSQAALAEKIGFSQRAVSKAINAGRTSAEMAAAIHDFTSGRVAKWELRPDLFDTPESLKQLAS